MLHWARKILLACCWFPPQILTTQIRSSRIFDNGSPLTLPNPAFPCLFTRTTLIEHLITYKMATLYIYSILHKAKFTITGTNYYHWMEFTLRTTPTLQKWGGGTLLNMERNMEEFDITCA